jgi:hypothetical protein
MGKASLLGLTEKAGTAGNDRNHQGWITAANPDGLNRAERTNRGGSAQAAREETPRNKGWGGILKDECKQVQGSYNRLVAHQLGYSMGTSLSE